MINNPHKKIVVASPDARKAGYHLALAMQENQLLDLFLTSTFIGHKTVQSKLLRKILGEKANLRSFEELSESKVMPIFGVDLLRRLAQKNPDSLYTVTKLASYYFDYRVAQCLKFDQHSHLLATSDACSKFAIPKAKKLGIKVILLCTVPSSLSWQEIWKEEVSILHNLNLINQLDLNDILLRDNFEPNSWITKRRMKEVQLADQIVAYSPFIKETLQKEGVDESKIFVLPKGTDDNLYQVGQFNELDNRKFFPITESNLFNILYVGSLSWRKGIFYALEAVKRTRLNNVKFTIIGGGIWSCLIPSYSEEINIEFLGKVPNNQIGHYYAKADVFLFPSLLEGSAHVTYEAMMSGLPQITTPNAGSFVEHGKEGFLTQIRDTEAMANYLIQLYYNTELRKTMSYAAFEKSKTMKWSFFRNGIYELIKS